MPVGNDVVDLRDPDNQPAAIHPRFDQRVFTDGERALLDALNDGAERHRLRWSLWAAKESAFKYQRQVDPRVAFHPRTFRVELEAPTGGRVHHGDRTLDLALDVTPRRVHALVASGARPVVAIREVESGPPVSPAAATAHVRRLAAELVGELLGIAPEEIVIAGPRGMAAPTGTDIPRAVRDGTPLDVAVSLSHDGSWGAAAATLQRSVVEEAAAPLEHP